MKTEALTTALIHYHQQREGLYYQHQQEWITSRQIRIGEVEASCLLCKDTLRNPFTILQVVNAGSTGVLEILMSSANCHQTGPDEIIQPRHHKSKITYSSGAGDTRYISYRFQSTSVVYACLFVYSLSPTQQQQKHIILLGLQTAPGGQGQCSVSPDPGPQARNERY